MRDDSHRWDAPVEVAAPLALGEATLAPVPVDRQTLISGPVVRRQADAPLIEWPGAAPEGPYALSLRRDRVLEVNGPARAEGWDAAAGQAVSDVTDSYAVFDLSGPGAMTLLARGAEISPDVPSRSVARLLFGLEVLVYRLSGDRGVRLHVPRAQAQAMVKHLVQAAAHAGEG